MSDIEDWERDAAEFHADTGFMRPGKDDARGEHTLDERQAAFVTWWFMRRKVATARAAGFSAGLEAGAKVCDEQVAASRVMGEPSGLAELCRNRIRALLAEATTTTERSPKGDQRGRG